METVTGSRLHSSLRFRISLFKLGTGKKTPSQTQQLLGKAVETLQHGKLEEHTGKTPIWKTVMHVVLDWKSWQQAGADTQIDLTWLTTSAVEEQFLICPRAPGP